jgi:hypothetical protein
MLAAMLFPAFGGAREAAASGTASGSLRLSRPPAETYTLTVTGGTGGGDYSEGTVVPIIAGPPLLGKTFDRWTGDTAAVANVDSASTTVTMPAADVSVVAAYRFVPYTLTVNSGSGDGQYTVTTVVPISADTAPLGKEFDRWTGDTDTIANVSSANTTVTIAVSDITLTATYKDVYYTLTVNSGSGDGQYTMGTTTPISANAAPSGLVFDRWVGDTSPIFNRYAADTTVTMPAGDVTVAATYKDPRESYVLTVDFGSGSGVYYEDDMAPVVADLPAQGMQFDKWTGDTEYLADPSAASTIMTMPAADVTVTAAYVSSLLRVTCPSDGGICMERGGKGAITWSAPGLDPKAVLRIELNDGADTWVLTEKAKAGKGLLTWTTGQWKSKTGQPVYPDGDNYRIRICTLDELVEDSSDEPFAIGTVTSLEILGPTEVDENSSAQYTCMAHFNFGDPRDCTNAKLKWGTSSKAAKIKKGGLMTIKEVAVDEPCTITAGYGKKDNYVEDSFDVTIKNR